MYIYYSGRVIFLLVPDNAVALSSTPLPCDRREVTGSLHRSNFGVMQIIYRRVNPGIYARNADWLPHTRSGLSLPVSLSPCPSYPVSYEITMAFPVAGICYPLNNTSENLLAGNSSFLLSLPLFLSSSLPFSFPLTTLAFSLSSTCHTKTFIVNFDGGSQRRVPTFATTTTSSWN